MVEIDHGFTTEMTYGIAGRFTNKFALNSLKLLTSEYYNVSKVYPITRKHKVIGNLTAYYSIKDLPEPIDVLIMLHKPHITLEILYEVLELSYKPAIWFLPGTSSPETIAFCEDNNLKYAQSCLFGHRQFKGIGKFVNMHYYHSKIAGMNQIPKQNSEGTGEEKYLIH